MILETVTLMKIKAYAVYSSDDEMTGSIKGYFKDSHIAAVKAKGAGWYGSDGRVDIVDVWKDKDENIYLLTPLGKHTDVAQKYRQDTLESIKSKLSKHELELLGIK